VWPGSVDSPDEYETNPLTAFDPSIENVHRSDDDVWFVNWKIASASSPMARASSAPFTRLVYQRKEIEAGRLVGEFIRRKAAQHAKMANDMMKIGGLRFMRAEEID